MKVYWSVLEAVFVNIFSSNRISLLYLSPLVSLWGHTLELDWVEPEHVETNYTNGPSMARRIYWRWSNEEEDNLISA